MNAELTPYFAPGPPLAPTVVDILRCHKKRQAEERLAAGGEWEDHNLIFCWPTGQPRSVESHLRSFYRLQEKTGMRRFRVHDLRHAFLSYLLALGEDVKTIQELARHSSIYVTMNTYAHVMPAAKRGTVDKLGGVIDRSVDIG
jgi:integrase